jgi:hypothetical protein
MISLCVLQVNDVPLEPTTVRSCWQWWSLTTPLRATWSCCRQLPRPHPRAAGSHNSDLLLLPFALFLSLYCGHHTKLRLPPTGEDPGGASAGINAINAISVSYDELCCCLNDVCVAAYILKNCNCYLSWKLHSTMFLRCSSYDVAYLPLLLCVPCNPLVVVEKHSLYN